MRTRSEDLLCFSARARAEIHVTRELTHAHKTTRVQRCESAKCPPPPSIQWGQSVLQARATFVILEYGSGVWEGNKAQAAALEPDMYNTESIALFHRASK